MIHFRYSGYNVLILSLRTELSIDPLYTYKITNNQEETACAMIYNDPLSASEAAEIYINKIQLGNNDLRRVS